jgi:hypothetical protein
MRFEADMSQTQIAAAIGISTMHVSRLLLRSVARLHEAFITEPRRSNGQATRRRRRSSATPTPAAVAPTADVPAIAAA